jgi:hypothetical protein
VIVEQEIVFYQILLLTPAVLHDLVSSGRIHRAYVVGLAWLAGTMLATHFFVQVDAWIAFGRHVMASAL